MSKALKQIWSIFAWLAVLAVVALAFLLAGVRLIGFTPYTVLSGSMEPAYPVGALVYVRPVAPESIQVGDTITFYLGDERVVATHRVIRADVENRRFYTQGDANGSPDAAPVPFGSLIGRVAFSVPRLGYFSAWLSRPPGLYAGVGVGAALILLLVLPDLWRRAGVKKERPRH